MTFLDAVVKAGDLAILGQSCADVTGRPPNEGDFATAYSLVFAGDALAHGAAAGERIATANDPRAACAEIVREAYGVFTERLIAACALVAQLAGALGERAGVEPAEVIRQCVEGAKAAMNDER